MPSQSTWPRTGLSGGGSSGKSDEIQFARSFWGANAHGSVGAKRERGCRESGKQKRKCVDESREGERCFIDRDGRGDGW
jgi:hypothetical protein